MKKIVYISVVPEGDADPADPPKAVYVDPPEVDALASAPFVSGRHRIQRTPDADDKPPVTLWSWTEGDR